MLGLAGCKTINNWVEHANGWSEKMLSEAGSKRNPTPQRQKKDTVLNKIIRRKCLCLDMSPNDKKDRELAGRNIPIPPTTVNMAGTAGSKRQNRVNKRFIIGPRSNGGESKVWARKRTDKRNRCNIATAPPHPKR